MNLTNTSKESSIMCQFHCVPSEIPILISELLVDNKVFVVRNARNSKVFTELSLEERGDNKLIAESENLIFTLNKPSFGATSTYDFVNLNPGSLILMVGKINSIGLEESSIGAITFDTGTHKKWQKAVDNLKKVAKNNTTEIIRSETGEKGSTKHRFTEGAEELSKQGIKMLTASGNDTLYYNFNVIN